MGINFLKGDTMNKEYKLGDIAEMKKLHPCGSNKWKIIRLGADIKLKCIKCDRIVMLTRVKFEKGIKKIYPV